MKLLDLFCGAGGAAAGYHRAGFDEIVGVDIEPQPNYPFEFVQADAMTFSLDGFDLVHASPPCQAYSPLNAYNHRTYPDLVVAVRARLTGSHYVIENVIQAPLLDPVVLCGATFGLRLYRHRGFESSAVLAPRTHMRHEARCVRNGRLPTEQRPFMTISGGKHSARWQRVAAATMGTLWMRTIREVCEAVPPAYTEHIGRQILAA